MTPMIGSKKWITLTSVALSGAICAAPLLAQNQGRTSGGNMNAGGNKPGVFRSFFQNAFGRAASNEPDPENEPEAPPVNSNKPRTMPKAANNFKQPTKSNTTPLIEPSDDGGPRTFFNRPQPTSATSSLSSIARNVCLCHPDARREMIAALNDRSEARRLAAVQALVSAAQHQCPQCGRSPCDDDVVAQILADIAYGKDASSRWLEPSENVRYTAREALRFSHRDVDNNVAPPPPVQGQMPVQRRQAGSFVSDDDSIPSQGDFNEPPRSTQSKPAPVMNNQPGANPNRSSFNNRSPAQSRTLSNAPAAVVSDDPVDPPRPMPSNSRSGIGFSVPGRGSNTAPARISNPTINDEPPANDPTTIESEPIPTPLDSTRRGPAPSRLMAPELDTSEPVTDASPPAPRGGAVIVEDSPPSLPDTSATRRTVPVDEVSPELNSNDSSSGSKVSSRRGKRATPAPVAAPALASPMAETPRVETPTAPVLTPSPIGAPSVSISPTPSAPAAPVISSPVTPAPITSLTPGLGTPIASPSPAPAAPTAATPTLVAPTPEPASPTPALAPTQPTEEPGPTPAPVRSSTSTAAPIRSVGPSGSSSPSLAPKPLSGEATSGQAPTLAPSPAGGPQLGPAAKKPTPAGSPGVIRSSFDMSPARGSRISAYDENSAAPLSQGPSTIKIK
ncbi:MAG: hypothetical protein JNM18_11355 [Planctomycetaceae bacterium]|nr:hypothetical protein [Planctomycetaceae bacterium]